MNPNETFYLEAKILSRYLIGKTASEKECALYTDAMDKSKIPMTKREQKIWNFMMKNFWAIGCMDGALAIENPESTIRRKIFIMLAILETSKENLKFFLPKKFPSYYLLTIILIGFRSILRLIAGIILIRFI